VNSLLQKAAAGLTGGASEAATEPVDYSKQLYDGGDRCHNGIIRHSVITFQCSTASQIEEVTEYEVRPPPPPPPPREGNEV
jgi:hypothetical protein